MQSSWRLNYFNGLAGHLMRGHKVHDKTESLTLIGKVRFRSDGDKEWKRYWYWTGFDAIKNIEYVQSNACYHLFPLSPVR